jgi:hypothetical protein
VPRVISNHLGRDAQVGEGVTELNRSLKMKPIDDRFCRLHISGRLHMAERLGLHFVMGGFMQLIGSSIIGTHTETGWHGEQLCDVLTVVPPKASNIAER